MFLACTKHRLRAIQSGKLLFELRKFPFVRGEFPLLALQLFALEKALPQFGKARILRFRPDRLRLRLCKLLFVRGDAALQPLDVLLGVSLVRLEFALRGDLDALRLRMAGVHPLGERFAVSLQPEEVGDELEPLPALCLDELRKFPLRERDTLFKVALFQPDDLF